MTGRERTRYTEERRCRTSTPHGTHSHTEHVPRSGCKVFFKIRVGGAPCARVERQPCSIAAGHLAFQTTSHLQPHADPAAVQVPLAPGGMLGAGQYQYAFAFALPHHLPGSFEYSCGSTSANIRYKVKAVCRRPELLKSNIKCSQRLAVLQRTRMTPLEHVVQSRVGAAACRWPACRVDVAGVVCF